MGHKQEYFSDDVSLEESDIPHCLGAILPEPDEDPSFHNGYFVHTEAEEKEHRPSDSNSDENRRLGTAASSLYDFLIDIGKVKLLTADEEVLLAKRVERGDKMAKQRMIEANLRLVVKMAKSYRNRGLPFLDLIQEGTFGLTRAIELFDWRLGYKLSTYATPWIIQALQRAVDNHQATIRVPVHMQDLRRKSRREHNSLTQKLGKTPSREEINNHTLLTPNELKSLEYLPLALVSLNGPVGEGEDELGDFVEDTNGSALTSQSVIDKSNQRDISQKLARGLAVLTESELEVVVHRFGLLGNSRRTLGGLAAMMSLETTEVRKLERSATQALKKVLEIDMSDLLISMGINPKEQPGQILEDRIKTSEVVKTDEKESLEPHPPTKTLTIEDVRELWRLGKAVPLDRMPKEYWWSGDMLRFGERALGKDF